MKLTTQNTLPIKELYNHVCHRCNLVYADEIYADFIKYASSRLPNVTNASILTYDDCMSIIGGFGRMVLELSMDVNYLFRPEDTIAHTQYLQQTYGVAATLLPDSKDGKYLFQRDDQTSVIGITSKDITNMINHLAGWDGVGSAADHNRANPTNPVRAIDSKNVLQKIRKYISQYFPHLLNKIGGEGGSNLSRLAPALHQPLGFYDAGMGVYTSSINQQQSLLVFTPDLAELVCTIFNPLVPIRMQQEILRLRQIINGSPTNAIEQPQIPLDQMNAPEQPQVTIEPQQYAIASNGWYTIKQAIQKFGDNGYVESVLMEAMNRHAVTCNTVSEGGLLVNIFPTHIWECAYRINPMSWGQIQ